MASNGIRDKVAIVGMGCTAFGEHWDKSVDDLLVEAVKEASTTSGIPLADVDAFSLHPPVVVAVVDFDGGGRFQCELTDVDPATVAIGQRVEMTFRRLFTAEGVHNYFWKAKPIATEVSH